MEGKHIMCEWLTPNSIMQLDISSYNLKNYELSTSKKKNYFCAYNHSFIKKRTELMEEQILIRITGQDRPGLIASVMTILAKYNAHIFDIGQADIHSTLSLGILIRSNELSSGQIMKELLFKATELGVNIGFTPVSDEEYESWVNNQGKNRYILTIIGRSLSAKNIEATTKVIAAQGFNIDSIRRLTGRQSYIQAEPACQSLHRVLPAWYSQQ